MNGSRELDNRFKNRLQAESRAFVGLALLLCSKSFEDLRLFFYGFIWSCFSALNDCVSRIGEAGLMLYQHLPLW